MYKTSTTILINDDYYHSNIHNNFVHYGAVRVPFYGVGSTNDSIHGICNTRNEAAYNIAANDDYNIMMIMLW